MSLAVRIYAGYKSVQLWSRYVSKAKADERYRRQDLRAARALYRTAVKLEGLLIKACQFIATRADILPDEWVDTLSVLHDRVPPRPFELIRDQVEGELGRPLEEIFPSFNRAADRLGVARPGARSPLERWAAMRRQSAVSRH